jgi:hypothetical protein
MQEDDIDLPILIPLVERFRASGFMMEVWSKSRGNLGDLTDITKCASPPKFGADGTVISAAPNEFWSIGYKSENEVTDPDGSLYMSVSNKAEVLSVRSLHNVQLVQAGPNTYRITTPF